jgi:hypothetical protein
MNKLDLVVLLKYIYTWYGFGIITLYELWTFELPCDSYME